MARRTVFLVAFCAAVVSVSTFVAALATEKGPPKSSLETPKELIQKLQDRVAQLEVRVNALEQKQGFVALPLAVPAPLELKSDGALPKGWDPREFNGMQ